MADLPNAVPPFGLVPPTSFIGRERELQQVVGLLARPDMPLLTLIGPGGMGKTRVAYQVLEVVRDTFANGAVFIPLAPISDPELVLLTVAQALEVPEAVDQPLLARVLTFLKERHLLLVLDNAEHVLDAVAALVVDLLRACPRLKILVTSRALLRVSGEQALPVLPLTLPEPGTETQLDQVATSAAVQLFADRSRSVVPSFALTEANAPAVAAICRHLDGLPLAIELAAAQGSVLPPAALLARIEARLPLPFSGPHDAPDRLRTMRDAIAWSYALLPANEQRLFRCVAVFSGGWGLEGAEAVFRAVSGDAEGDGGGSSADLLSALAALVEKSLVRQEERDGEARFWMLETIRGFGLELLEEYGERAAASDAHAEWCLHQAHRSWLAPLRPNGEPELAHLEVELPNLRAALEWLEPQGDHHRLALLASGLSALCYARNYYWEGITRLERALATTPPNLRMERARVLVQLAMFLVCQGNAVRAGSLLDEGIATLRDTGDTTALALALIWQGAAAMSRSDPVQTEQVLEEAIGLAGTIDDPGIAAATTARALANLGVAAHERGDLELARIRHEMALRSCREHGYVLGAIRSLRDLGDVARDQGDYVGAVGWYRQSMAELGDRSEGHVLIDVLEGIALAAVTWGQAEQAVRLLGAADALADRLGVVALLPTDRLAHERSLAAGRVALGGSRFEAAWAAGRQLTVAEAVAQAGQVRLPDDATAGDQRSIRLSARERQVLRLLAAGAPDREIAETLFLSVRTVEAHVSHIRNKLGVHTRTAAATAAIAAGLVEPGDSG